MKPKKKTSARPVHANRGIELEYRKKLNGMISEMANSLEYWISAQYKKSPPKISLVAADASPVSEIAKSLKELGDKWIKKFNDAAPAIAKFYLSKMFKASDRSLRQALKDAGWAVDFKMSPLVKEAFLASLGENVGLIKSIPQQYLTQVEGVVMRAYSAGRDLQSMVDGIRKIYPVTQKRAAFIARDQSNKANAVANRARQMDLGITEAVWVHSHAGKTPRPDHVAADGKKYKIADGCLISGKHIQPGEEINCRCVARPVLPF